MKLRVGLIGLGDVWETRHQPALRALSDRFEIRAVCAEVAAKAEQAASEFNASVVDGFRALIAREDIDALLMFAPGWYGPLPILAACDAEKAVFCKNLHTHQAGPLSEFQSRIYIYGSEFVLANYPIVKLALCKGPIILTTLESV